MDGGLDASGMAREHLYRTQQRPLASQHCKHASDSEGKKWLVAYIITFKFTAQMSRDMIFGVNTLHSGVYTFYL